MCTHVVIFQPINGVYFLTAQICCYFPFSVLFVWCLQIRGEPGKIPLYLLYILSKIFHAPSCQYPGVGVVNNPCCDTYSLIIIKHHIFPISFTSDSKGLNVIYTEGISSSSLARKQKYISSFIIQRAISFFFFFKMTIVYQITTFS